MNRINLIKLCNEPTLAHVYEHIFLSSFVSLCNSQGLLSYIDYRWYGKTYQGGFIHIDIMLLTPRAKQLAQVIRELKPEFTKKTVKDAFAEIWAERKKYDGANSELIYQALENLQDRPWQDITELSIYDRYTQRRSRKIAWESDQNIKTTALYCSFALDASFAQSQRQLLPLFGMLTSALGDNLTDTLGDTMHAYLYDTTSVCNKTTTKSAYKLRILANSHSNDLADELKMCETTLSDLFTKQLVKRLVDFLQDGAYLSEGVGPDELKIYETYEILIGDAGWKQIATEANINNLLLHMTFEIAAGEKRQAMRLSSLL